MLLPISDTEDTRYGTTPMTTIIIVVCALVWFVDIFISFSDFSFLVYLAYYFLGTNPELILNQEGFGFLNVDTFQDLRII